MPSRIAGPKRFQPVPLRALPPLDLVLVSHDHYDDLLAISAWKTSQANLSA